MIKVPSCLVASNNRQSIRWPELDVVRTQSKQAIKIANTLVIDPSRVSEFNFRDFFVHVSVLTLS